MGASAAVAVAPSMSARQVRSLIRQERGPHSLPPTRQGSHASCQPSCCCRAATGWRLHPRDPARSCCSIAAGSGAAQQRRQRQRHWAGSACERRKMAADGRVRSGWRAGGWVRCVFVSEVVTGVSSSVASQCFPHDDAASAAALPGSTSCSAVIECDVPIELAFGLWEDRGRIPQWMPWITSVVVRTRCARLGGAAPVLALASQLKCMREIAGRGRGHHRACSHARRSLRLTAPITCWASQPLLPASSASPQFEPALFAASLPSSRCRRTTPACLAGRCPPSSLGGSGSSAGWPRT